MVIEKVHGLQATAISMNDRFSLLASAAPDRVAKQRRRPSAGFNNGQSLRNRNLVEQIARRLEQQKRWQILKQRLGVPGQLRRFGSEGNLPGLRRSNSFGNLNQWQSIKNRVAWRQSNGNLSRSASWSNLPGGRPLRGFRRRGGGQRALRGRFRGGRGGSWRGGVNRKHYIPLRAAQETRGARGGRPARGLAPGLRGRGQFRGRGDMRRNQGNNQQKPVPSKEELDEELDQYMACTKTALDKELDNYMKNAMDLSLE